MHYKLCLVRDVFGLSRCAHSIFTGTCKPWARSCARPYKFAGGAKCVEVQCAVLSHVKLDESALRAICCVGLFDLV